MSLEQKILGLEQPKNSNIAANCNYIAFCNIIAPTSAKLLLCNI